MRILIAPDKFKGVASAEAVARALARGFDEIGGDLQTSIQPVADGGDGTDVVLVAHHRGTWRSVAATDAAGRPITTRYGWIERDDGPMAVIAMSEAAGLRRLRDGDVHNPMLATTRGVGTMLVDAVNAGASVVLVGLGGSATNDGGVGLATALGYRFFDAENRALSDLPDSLGRLARIEAPQNLTLPPVIAAADVHNPLLGTGGATQCYGPQKGADEAQLRSLEQGLSRLAEVAARGLGKDHRDLPGAGAAGGLGYGLATFANAELRPGFEVVAEEVELGKQIDQADLVITAEGAMDRRTLLGKAPGGVASLAHSHGRPVLAFTGQLEDEADLQEHFDGLCPIVPGPMSRASAMQQTLPLLRRAAARTARLLFLDAHEH